LALIPAFEMLTSEEQQNDKPSTSTTKAAVAGREVKKPIK